MAYDLNDFTSDPTRKTTVDNSTGFISVGSNTVLGSVWETLKAAVRFKATKIILYFVFMGLFVLVTGDFIKSKNIAEDASVKAANDDYFGLTELFAKETGHRSTKLNMHPFYHTKGVRELESKYKIDFGREIKIAKDFAYVIYKDQDFIVMKGPARGKDAEKLKLEYSTIFGMSASDYCNEYFEGFVPDEDLRKEFVSSMRVRKIKDELTEENDDGKKMFRCIIDADTIEDFIENDREN